MPSDHDSGDDGRRRPPSRPPEDESRRGQPDENEIDPGLRPPKRPSGQRFGAPHSDSSDPEAYYPEEPPFTAGSGPGGPGGRPPPPPVSGRFEDPWFEDPMPLDDSRRPPKREQETDDGFYAAQPYDYDDYRAPQPPEERARPRSRTLPVIIALLALGGFAALLWYAYTWGVGGLESEDLPVVAAEQSPAKVAPEEPGGMEIPNQDKQVLNQQEEGQGGAEQLLPPPEEPNPPVVTDNPPPAPSENSQPTEDSAQEETASSQSEQQSSAPLAPQPTEETAPETAPAASEQPAAQAGSAPEPPAQLTEAPPGAFVMQLASVRSPEAARSEWARMQQEHELLLGDMPLFIQQVELEGRGTYHRIQTGPFPSRSTAQDFCAQLKAAGQDCLVTQR